MKNLIINDYVNNYLGTQELARKYNLHRTTIQKYLKSENVELRKRTSRIKVNNFYFSKYNRQRQQEYILHRTWTHPH